MSKTSSADETVVQSLHDKCSAIKEVLLEADGVAAKIVFGPKPIEKAMKEPTTTLESLANELIDIQGLSENLLGYLVQMDETI